MSTPRRGIEDRIPDLGPRGEGWVALQAVLLVTLVACGGAGPSVSGGTRAVLFAVGVVLIALGVALGTAGIVRQRRQLTALPRPMAGAVLVDDGPFAWCATRCTAGS